MDLDIDILMVEEVKKYMNVNLVLFAVYFLQLFIPNTLEVILFII